MKIQCLLPFLAVSQEFDEDFSGSVRLEAPALDSEEGGNWHIAPHLLCDACRIISMEINQRITGEINKFPSVKSGKKDLSEDRVLEIIEEICDDPKTFKDAGLKVIDGVQERLLILILSSY